MYIVSSIDINNIYTLYMEIFIFNL